MRTNGNISPIKEKDLEHNIAKITLLSISEYYRYRDLISNADRDWWLRSIGNHSETTANVHSYGAVNAAGDHGGLKMLGVRPALCINISDSSNLQPGDKIQLLNQDWTVLDIKENQIYVLADDIVAKRFFDSYNHRWKFSDLKKWLEKDWLPNKLADNNKYQNIMMELECNVNEITLLSREEFEKYKSIMPDLKKHWWLRSPGGNLNYTMYVFPTGSCHIERCCCPAGCNVTEKGLGVRPALHLSISSSSNLQPGDKLQLFNQDWTVLDVKTNQIYVLADDIIIKKPFHHRSCACSWGMSSLKIWLENWLEEQYKEYRTEMRMTLGLRESKKVYSIEHDNELAFVDCDGLKHEEEKIGKEKEEAEIEDDLDYCAY